MLEWLLAPLAAHASPEGLGLLWKAFRVLRYPTFRTAMAALTAFLLCVFLGPRVIAWLRRMKVADRPDACPSAEIRDIHQGKADTPTMGGAFIVPAVVATALLWARPSFHVLLAVFTLVGFAMLGAIDDLTKLLRLESRGINIVTKLLIQGTLAVCAGTALYWHSTTPAPPAPAAIAAAAVPVAPPGSLDAPTTLRFPFFKSWGLNLAVLGGIPFVLLAALVVVSASNAVNLTDGLDGLATGLFIPVVIALGVLAFVAGDPGRARYLFTPFVPGGHEVMVLCGALLGAAFGFLWFNAHPAQVFLGDTGSLSLGAVVGLVAVMVRQELLLLLLAGVFVAEALSVVLQVASFRLSGKRIFRCAPLHHHFQLGGLPETVVTARFWIVGGLLMMLALSTLKLR